MPPTVAFHRSQFRASPNGRHLITGGGQPFVWLADNAGVLTRRLDRGDIDLYLRTRVAQRFTVIHAAVFAGADALTTPNAYGLLPFDDGDLARPTEGFFTHLDHVVLRANALGVAVALQPLTAEVVGSHGFDATLAAGFAGFLAKRYRDQAVMWVVGGGDGPEDVAQQAVWNALGSTLREQTRGRQLIAYLPTTGPTRGAGWAQALPWHDLALHRSGPGVAQQPWLGISAGYRAEPTRPLLDAFPGREDQPAPEGESDGHVSAHQERMVAYWSVFSGACGHTYANHEVCRYHEAGGHEAHAAWEAALHDPAAEQMHFLRQLLEARPFQARVPDQALLPHTPTDPARYQCATRGDDDDLGGDGGSYAFIYTPVRQPVVVDLTRLTGSLVEASWFDPRTGRSIWLGQFPVRGTRTFTPLGEDDWVLVLDDSGRNYQPVGHAADRSMSF
ncbi:MAG TPA: glycoside hydrolase family 140 protein [Planctomycetota bacterium]|nr:glycoside hydrolase family 140 protein [Planctomycetota bacterium]